MTRKRPPGTFLLTADVVRRNITDPNARLRMAVDFAIEFAYRHEKFDPFDFLFECGVELEDSELEKLSARIVAAGKDLVRMNGIPDADTPRTLEGIGNSANTA